MKRKTTQFIGGSMYQFKDKINYTNFFRFDKELVRRKKWANLPKASKSVYPAIVVHCDAKGVAFPGQETIAILAGRTPKTVREGLKGLEGFPGFESYKALTGRGHKATRYKIDVTPDETGRSFSLYKCIFESGWWSLCSPNAHSLYIVMRTFSFFEGELYCELEDIPEETDYDLVGKLIEDRIYQNRKYDFISAEFDVMSEYSGIRSKSGLSDAIQNLEKNCLIQPLRSNDGDRIWKIYRIPPIFFPPSLRNDKVKSRYGNKETVNKPF
jgi:hypothetical protein